MHRVSDDWDDGILVGLGECTSKKGFANDSIQIGDKVRLIIEEPRRNEIHDYAAWSDSVRAVGFLGTWGTVGVHYKLDYIYPYMDPPE